MPPGKVVSDGVAKVVYNLHGRGESLSSIAKIIEISRSTVQRILKRRIPNTEQQQTRQTGRPRVTSPRTDRAILVGLKHHRFSTYRQLATQFNVSHGTIRRRANENGYRSKIAVLDVLGVHQKATRLLWCYNHLGTDFRPWAFSDESSFELSNCSAPYRTWVHRTRGEKFKPATVLPAPVKSHQKVMVWGCIMATGHSAFCLVRGTINRQKYIEILAEHLIPMLDDLPLQMRANVVFQQDNARPHVAQDTLDFLEREGIQTTPWPAYSPDLNPIENLWAIMKRHVRMQSPHSIPELEQILLSSWRQVVTQNLCNRLISSMPTRLHNVIAHRGIR